MKKCQACGTENQAASLFCEECGARLPVSENERRAEKSDFRPQISEMPVFQSSAGATSIGIPSPQSFEPPQKNLSSGENEKSNGAAAHATLIIERGSAAGTKFALRSDESNIGRWDADNGVFPDVDLDKHDPEAKISRRHARIVRRADGRYAIEDLGSTNGTFVNRGRRLIPGSPNVLNNGDEIIIGKTFLRFYIDE